MTKGTKESSPMPDAKRSKAEVLLQKIVGRLPEDKAAGKIFDCQVTSSDLADPGQVKALLLELEKVELTEAYLFRAADPSIELFGFIGEKKFLIFEYASSRKYPKPNDQQGLINTAAEQLIKIADGKCPTPTQGI